MTTFKVTLMNKNRGFIQTIDVPETESILGEAAEQGIKIPFECVIGACAICQGTLISGAVDQSEQLFLSEEQIESRSVLLCVAKPLSDCSLEVELEDYL